MVTSHLSNDTAHRGEEALAALKALANGALPNLPPEEPALVPGTADWDLHKPVEVIHKDDLNTKDDWVPRWACTALQPGAQRPAGGRAVEGGSAGNPGGVIAYRSSYTAV